MGSSGYPRGGRRPIAYANSDGYSNYTSESDAYAEQSGRFAYSDTHCDPDINTYRTTKSDTTASADTAFSAVSAR